MRCVPGDLALVVCGRKYLGQMVTVMWLEDPSNCGEPWRGSVWRVDREFAWIQNGLPNPIPYLPDSYLMPIRPLASEETDQAEARASKVRRALG